MAGIQFAPVQGPQGGVAGGQAAMPAIGIQGGQAQVGRTVAGKDWYEGGMDAGLGLPPEWLNEVFAAPLQVQKQQREWQGYTDAVAGTTAEEIREKQPWYTKVFGPTDYETGVVAFETQKKSADLVRDWSLRMPELRQLPAEQVSVMLQEQMNSMMSDSPFANAVLQKSMLTQIAPLLEQHTKEREAWKQAGLLKVQTENFQSNSATYQLLMSKAATLGGDTPMDINAARQLEAAKSSLFDALQSGLLQNDDSIKSFVTNSLRSAMRNGEFYTVEAMLDEDILSALPIEVAESMQKAYITAKSQYKNRYSADNPDFEKMLAQAATLKQFGFGGEPIRQLMGEINATYSAMTGDPEGYYDSAQIAAYASDSSASYLRIFEREEDRKFARDLKNLEREEKAMAEAHNAAQLTGYYASGSLGEAIMMKGVEKGDADRASTARFGLLMSEGKVDQAMNGLVHNFNNVRGSFLNDQLSKQMQTNLSNSMDEMVNDAFLAQYEQWNALHTAKGFAIDGDTVTQTDGAAGAATAIAYYGEQVDRKMREFKAKKDAGMTDDRAYATTFGEWVKNGRPDFRGIERGEQKASTKAFLEVIRGESAGLYSRMFGNGYKLHPSAEIQLAQAVGPYWEQLGDGMLPEHRAKAALQLAKQAGRMEIVGGQVLHWSRNQKSLQSYLGDPDGERTSVLFDNVLREKLKAVGSTPDGNSVIINRLQDENGEPVFAVHVETDDGFENVDIRGTDLTGFDMKKAQDTRTKVEAPSEPLTFGFRMPRTSSEENKAYREATRLGGMKERMEGRSWWTGQKKK